MEANLNQKNRLGGWIALLAGLMNVVGTFLLFTKWYFPMQKAEIAAGRPDEKVIVQNIWPALMDIGILGAILFLLAAYLFFLPIRLCLTSEAPVTREHMLRYLPVILAITTLAFTAGISLSAQ